MVLYYSIIGKQPENRGLEGLAIFPQIFVDFKLALDNHQLSCYNTQMKKTKNIQPIEQDYSKFIRDNFDGWIERVERGRGMNDGYPDLSLLLPSGLELAELKIGSVVDGVLWCEEVRPSQISFHHRLADHGGRSFFLVGVWCGDSWRSFAFDGTIARYWETTGYKIGETCFEIDNRNLFDSLTDFVYEQLEN